MRVVESYTEDAKGEVEVEKVTIMEERNIDAENPGEYITLQMNRPVAVRDIEDDWFMLLEPTPVDFKPSPSGSIHTLTNVSFFLYLSLSFL